MNQLISNIIGVIAQSLYIPGTPQTANARFIQTGIFRYNFGP